MRGSPEHTEGSPRYLADLQAATQSETVAGLAEEASVKSSLRLEVVPHMLAPDESVKAFLVNQALEGRKLDVAAAVNQKGRGGENTQDADP